MRVLLIDDHELIRQGLSRVFERSGDDEVVGQAGSVAEGLAMAAVLTPDVVVTDLELPDGSGFDVVRRLRAASDTVGLVVLTMHRGDEAVLTALEAGASAFLTKETRGTDVVAAAHRAARAPRAFVAPSLAGALARGAAGAGVRLTPREQQVLRLVAEAEGTAGIARRLYMGESTVKTHLNRIFRKLGVSNRTQALAQAHRLGLLLDHAPSPG
ncbi:DNA-binding NarL/FixJ family response regulator [Nocardioides salarius]|uniref:DNA-binding NarL/FixJ family response regulator n=1 Tax=Nocardioides salarius TaxID=374513 RepID=A0ABS2MF18_9ACTN|nr:response regulator transcription factor [Nocardioides salarius]MBM7509784.1 DNA-binding NarL/FixJ family response regulator [Nocardioides salarius]